jgi:hypothetical protein
MRFTEAEAKAKKGKRVRVRDDSLWSARLAKGSSGEVVGARLRQSEEGGSKDEGWGVCIEFSVSRDHCVSILLCDMGKAQYEGALEEIAVAMSTQEAWSAS